MNPPTNRPGAPLLEKARALSEALRSYEPVLSEEARKSLSEMRALISELDQARQRIWQHHPGE